MRKGIGAKGVMCLAVLLLGMGILQGCSMVKIPESPMKYVQYRWNDLWDIMEFGVTYNGGPAQYAGYVLGLGVLGPAGGANLDVNYIGVGGGAFFGLGTGKPGFNVQRHRLYTIGFPGWGFERMGWEDYLYSDDETLNCQNSGFLGIVAGPDNGIAQYFKPGKMGANPGYQIACLHYVHLGHVGLVGNIRYLEPFDLIAGIFCLDPFQDDGPQPGRWWWQKKGRAGSEVRATARARTSY